MTHAYSILYVDEAMKNLGEMLDYAVNACHIELEQYWGYFLTSRYADQFGAGVPTVVCGRSGTELALDVLHSMGIQMDYPAAQVEYDYSPEYWCGWILAYYQWNTGKSFHEIDQLLPMHEVLKLYPTLHEASEDKFVDTINQLLRMRNYATKLQRLRKISGYSQRELAEKSDVNLRMIQQYESRAKDINKAAVITLLSISRVLGCQIQELLE